MKKVVAVLIVVGAVLLAGYLYDKVSTGAKVPVITINKDDGYKLMVDGKPYPIKGVCQSAR